MFENRISEQFQFTSAPNFQMSTVNIPPSVPAAMTAAPILPMVSMQDIYQMAAAQARYDYELDRLFNPEYYDNGSGI